MQKDNILQKYEAAIQAEGLHVPIQPEELYNIMMQLTEYAFSSLVPRSYNTRYLLTTEQKTFESVASHTLLTKEMMTAALNFFYRPNLIRTNDGFTYYEIQEAISRHDLPENTIGDKADNGERDNEGLARIEECYWRTFSEHSPKREARAEYQIWKLLIDQNSKLETVTGRQIHVADKAAGIFMNLCLEEKGSPPIMHMDSNIASKEERKQMSRCERHMALDDIKFCYASEMWTMSFFDRGTHKLDYHNFFTALIIMKTIAVTGKWYAWREKDHKSE